MKWILVFLSIMICTLVTAQTFELIEIDTNFIELDLSFHKEAYEIKLENHIDGNYIVYYYHTFPEVKCMTYSVLNGKLQGYLRRYNKKGILTFVEYYSAGKLKMKRKVNRGKIIEEKWFE